MYRRNRRQLIQAGTLPSSDILPAEPTDSYQQPENNPHEADSTLIESMQSTSVPSTAGPNTTLSDDTQSPRRSGRATRAPAWMADYVPSDLVD